MPGWQRSRPPRVPHSSRKLFALCSWLSPLELGRAEDQSSDHARVRRTRWIIERTLSDLGITQLLADGAIGLLRDVAVEDFLLERSHDLVAAVDVWRQRGLLVHVDTLHLPRAE